MTLMLDGTLSLACLDRCFMYPLSSKGIVVTILRYSLSTTLCLSKAVQFESLEISSKASISFPEVSRFSWIS